MRTVLRLQHHRHTAKRLPHHHTSYRSLFLLLILCGFLMVMFQRAGEAATYDVTATVPAPIPGSPAVITLPKNGTQFTAPQIEVSGICPIIQPAVIISLWRGNEILGSTICSPTGKFSVLLTLKSGVNIIIPKITTITFGQGQDGLPVSIEFHPPQVPSTGASTEVPPITALALRSTKTFITYTPDEAVQLDIEISQGVPPYSMAINWGDGTIDSWAFSEPGVQRFEHTYRTNLPLTITIHAQDSLNQTAQFNIAAVSFARYYGGNEVRLSGTTGGQIISPKYGLIWVIYGLTVLVAVIFWYRHRMIHPAWPPIYHGTVKINKRRG